MLESAAVMDDAALQFVRQCLRARHDAVALAAVCAAVDGGAVDWDALRAVARAARVRPLLYHLLRQHVSLPPEVQTEWRREYYGTAHRGLIVLHEVEPVLRSLRAAGVPVLMLKGLALAEAVYRNFGLRPFGDIDIVIQRDQLQTVLELATSAGYALYRTEPQAGSAAAYENGLLLQKTGRIRVDLAIHWSLFDSPYYQDTLDLSWFWNTAEPVRLGALEVLGLGPAAQLIYLPSHLMLHHAGAGLLWWNDIAEVIAVRGAAIDWRAVVERTQAYELVLCVRRALETVAAEWGAAVPRFVLDELRALRPSAGEQRVHDRLAKPDRPVAQRLWADLASMGRWRSRLGFAWMNLFPSPTYMRQRYGIGHPLLLPFYYPYRWWRGLLSAFE